MGFAKDSLGSVGHFEMSQSKQEFNGKGNKRDGSRERDLSINMVALNVNSFLAEFGWIASHPSNSSMRVPSLDCSYGRQRRGVEGAVVLLSLDLRLTKKKTSDLEREARMIENSQNVMTVPYQNIVTVLRLKQKGGVGNR